MSLPDKMQHLIKASCYLIYAMKIECTFYKLKAKTSVLAQNASKMYLIFMGVRYLYTKHIF